MYNNFVPDISIGRISIDNIEDGWNYLNKLKLYDSIPEQPWMKNFLFLSGGDSPGERRLFSRFKSISFDDYIKFPPFCGVSDSVAKYDEAVGGISESGTIREKINQGALWVNFVGHADQNVFDMDGWQTYKLNNYVNIHSLVLFPVIRSLCRPWNSKCQNEDYVFFKNKDLLALLVHHLWLG